jgi:hypothetical protein
MGKGTNRFQHTRRTFGKTTGEGDRLRASGLRADAQKGISLPSSAGVTRIVPRDVDLTVRQQLDEAVAAYYAEGEHRGGGVKGRGHYVGKKDTPGTLALLAAVGRAVDAGWSVAEIGRRFLRGPSAAPNLGRYWMRRVEKWREQNAEREVPREGSGEAAGQDGG